MSEASGGGDSPWQCRHCHKEFVVPKGVVFPFCPVCRAPAQGPESDFEAVYCVNPKCRIELFHPTQKRCHECGSIQAQQPQPPDAQATSDSTPTVHIIASVSPSTSDKAQRNLATSKHEDNQKDGVPYHVSTLPQHIPSTQQMAQGATGTIQAVHPTMSQTVLELQTHHVPAVNLPPHSQLVYPQAQQPGTEYPRVFGPPDDPQQWQQGTPNLASQPSIQCQAPTNQVAQMASQGSQVTPGQLPSQPTDGPQHKVLGSHPWPPMASSPMLSDGMPSSDSQPEQPPSPPSSQPNQGTNIPMTSSHTSLISQSSTVVSNSTTVSSTSHLSASRQDSSNQDIHSQLVPRQPPADAKGLPLNRHPLHDEEEKMDQEKEKEKEKSHEKTEEARKSDKGKGVAEEPPPVLKTADTDPLQQSSTHTNDKESPQPNNRKRPAERTADRSVSPPKQQKIENLNTSSSQTTEDQQRQGTPPYHDQDRQLENSGHPSKNSSTYGAERQASDQVKFQNACVSSSLVNWNCTFLLFLARVKPQHLIC